MTLEIETLSKELSEQFQDILSWQHDDRFETILTEFSIDKLQIVFKLFKLYFKESWDSQSIKTAPQSIQLNCKHFGELHSDQIFSATDSNSELYLYAAIWPWSDGQTISIRLAPYGKTMTASEQQKLTKQFRCWFGL